MNIKLMLKNFLHILVQKSPKGYHVTLKGKQFNFIVDYLNSLYPQLNISKYSIGTKVYWLLHDINDFPKCKNAKCHNLLNHKNAFVTTGYGSGYCSVKCEMNDVVHQQNLKKIFQDEYGVDSYPESNDFKQKFKDAWDKKTLEEKIKIKTLREQTTFDRYGAVCIFCNECETRKRIDENNIKNHGSKIWNNPQKSSQTKKKHSIEDPEYYDKIAKKRNNTVKELCEKDPLYRKKITEKTKNTIKRKSEKDPLYRKKIIEKTKNTIKRKSEKDPLYRKKITEKIMQTNIKNTGYAWPSQCPAIRSKMRRKYLYDNIMFDSSPEIAYYIWLKDHNIEFIFHPNVDIHYIDANGKLHYYEPDFLIVKTNQLEDIKGRQFFKKDISFKLSAEYLECLKKNNIRLILDDEYKTYIDYCTKKFDSKKWYLKFKYYKSSN